MAEIEIGVLRSRCLDRRIDDVAAMRAEVAAWEQQRNDAGATIEWTFTTERAREKMGRAYPHAAPVSSATVSSQPDGGGMAPPKSISTPTTERLALSSGAASVLALPVAAAAHERAVASTNKKPRTGSTRGPVSRFKARRTIPRRRPVKKKTERQPVRSSVRSC